MEIFEIFLKHFHLLDLEGGSVSINLICQVVKSPMIFRGPKKIKKIMTFVRNTRKASIVEAPIK